LRRCPASSRGSEDALTRLWSLTPADAAEALRARGAEHRLRCAVQLCALRATGRFVVDYRGHSHIRLKTRVSAGVSGRSLRVCTKPF
jgi:hypothetical protein